MLDVLVAYFRNGRINLAILRDVGADWKTSAAHERGNFASVNLEPGEAERMRLRDVRLIMNGSPKAPLSKIVADWRLAMTIAARAE